MNKTNLFESWANKGYAVVTGASSGLGKKFATELASQGFNLILVARRESRLRELAQQLEDKHGMISEVVVKDLSVEEDLAALSKMLSNREDIDVLVNNAGFGSSGDFAYTDFSVQLNMMKVHMEAPVKLMRSILPSMIEKDRGAVINLSSLGSWMPARGAGMYAATKAFLRVFTQSIKYELTETQVKVQALCPGFTHTEFHEDKNLKKVKTSTPKILWMDKDKVIQQSLSALSKGKTVVVPGFVNKIARWLLTSKLFGKALIKALQPKPNFGKEKGKN